MSKMMLSELAIRAHCGCMFLLKSGWYLKGGIMAIMGTARPEQVDMEEGQA